MVKPFAFVLMPFDADFSDIYSLGIQSAANEVGIVAERVDEQRFTETILDRIYRQIEAADIIIADMTGRNPNVFYEVGYAHAKNKPCVLLTQKAEDIPFDLKHHHHIVYGNSIKDLRSKLTPHLEWLSAEIKKNKTEPFTISLDRASGQIEKDEYFAEAIVDITFKIENKTERRSPEIETAYLYTGPNWDFSQSAEECPSKQVKFEGFSSQHLIRIPISKLSPGAWHDIKIAGRRRVWSKFTGEEYKDSYLLNGSAIFEIWTSEGTYRKSVNISVECDEFPF